MTLNGIVFASLMELFTAKLWRRLKMWCKGERIRRNDGPQLVCFYEIVVGFATKPPHQVCNCGESNMKVY